MKTVLGSASGLGLILGAQLVPDDVISRAVELLGLLLLLLLLLTTYLEWRRRSASRS